MGQKSLIGFRLISENSPYFAKEDSAGKIDWDIAQPVFDEKGERLPLRFLPGFHENGGVAGGEVIFLGDKDGHDALIVAFSEFERTKKGFTYHVYVPYVGNTVVVSSGDQGETLVNGEKVEEPILALREAFEYREVPPCMEELKERYFLEKYKKPFSDFSTHQYLYIVQSAGIETAMKIAQYQQHDWYFQVLTSWKEVGMESKNPLPLWMDRTKSQYHNHTYYYCGVVIAWEWYGSEAIRRLDMKKISIEDIERAEAYRLKEEEEKREARNQKFQELSQRVFEAYGAEVLTQAKKKKGAVLKTLYALVAGVEKGVTKEQVALALSLTSDAAVLANLLELARAETSKLHAGHVASKAYAWAYLSSAMPGVKFSGYFDSAREALTLYAEKWTGGKGSSEKNTLGDFFKLKGISL